MVRKYLLRIFVILIVAVVLFTVAFFLLVQFTPFDSSKLNTISQPTVVYSGNNQKYMTIGTGSSDLPYSDIPKNLQDALVATEDHSFWDSSSVDIKGILRAAFVDLWSGSYAQGASTIQEQLAKMVYLTDKKTLTRKLNQVILGVQINRHYTKQEILTMYLNRVFLGSNAVGVQEAAQLYFGVDLRHHPNQLTLTQAALLAGLPQAPSAYDPLVHPKAAMARRNIVLQNMANYGYITQAEAQKAANEPLGVSQHPVSQSGWNTHPLFTNFLFDWAQRHGITPEELSQGGLKIYTTIDPAVQAAIHNVFWNNSNSSDWPTGSSSLPVTGGALFLDPKTGGILGAAGSRKQDYTRLGLDRVYATSSPGSSIKPVMDYGPALESGNWNYKSILDDTPHDFGGGYTPQNWNANAPAKITLQYGIQWSQNVASVWLLQQIGIQNGVQFAMNDGIPISPSARNQLGIAIGGNLNVSPMIMAQAYEPFDNQGVQMQAHLINQIVNASGQVIYRDPMGAKTVMKASTATDMTRLMQDVVQFGTGQLAKVNGWGVAGKTGTVQYSSGLVGSHPNWVQDAWFDGYTPNMVGSIYVGYDNKNQGHMSWDQLDPSGNCAELFKDIVSQAVQGQTPEQFAVGPYPYSNGLPTAAMQNQNAGPAISGLTASWDAANQAVNLSWKSSGQSLEFTISRATVGQSTPTGSTPGTANTQTSSAPILIGQTQNTSFEDPGVTPGDTYQYIVQPIDPTTLQSVGSSATITVTVSNNTAQTPGNQVQQPGSNTNNGPGTPPTAGNGAANSPTGPGGGATAPNAPGGAASPPPAQPTGTAPGPQPPRGSGGLLTQLIGGNRKGNKH